MEKFIESTAKKRRVLAVDDEMINRELLGMILSADYDVDFAENGVCAMNKLSDNSYSLILLDLLMPEMNGFEVIERCTADEKLKAIPIIVMTSEKSAEVKSIKLGAADFITKPFVPEVILARCERIIRLKEDQSLIRSTEKDPLTNLYTREFFITYVKRMIPDITGEMDAVALNLDRFHLINGLFGLEEGDRVLKELARLITKYLLSAGGIACRTYGDNFFVYCRHREDYEETLVKIQTELSSKTEAKNVRIRGGVFPGISSESQVENWYHRAKAACSKLRGTFGNHVEIYDEALHEKELFREQLIADIDEVIEKRHFSVYFQPKYNVEGNAPVLASAETLVRWKHPDYGMISPGEFIPLFERNGLIRLLDNFVWREAAAQVRRWRDALGVTLPVSVNVSRVDVFDPELENKFTQILEEYELSHDSLLLEITESACSENEERFVEIIEGLRNKGFKIEMDDFGTGYSSLNMLTNIPIDAIKLDMQFVRKMLRDVKSLKLVQLVIDISDFLQVPVIAEGVETVEQLTTLKTMGCEIIQGYYFSPPLPAKDFTKLIEAEISGDKGE